MGRYIDIDKEIQLMQKAIERNEQNETGEPIAIVTLKKIIEVLLRIPPIDVEEVRHGRVIKAGKRYPICSECNASLERSYFKYCPYCGAIFDEDKSRIVDDAISEIKMPEELLNVK